MSRTYRRKKGEPISRYQLMDGYWDRDTLVWIRVPLSETEQRKVLAKWMSDSGRIMGNAPSWFCNVFQREARQEARRQLHLFMRNPENIESNTGFQVLIDPNHHRSATWSWW